MNPLTKPVAISEMLILLSACAFLGYTIARIISNGKIKGLQAAIADKQTELADCRSKKIVETAPVFVAPVAAFAAPATIAVTPDDLKIVEGIGPKIEGLLNKEGIFTFAQLANTSADTIRGILQAGGKSLSSNHRGGHRQ